jgi:NAD(P)H-hydrate epimerase
VSVATPFTTAEGGIPVPSVTVEGMREIDRIVVEETGPDLLQMMENAGRSLAELALARLSPGGRVVVVAGGGGNGGGGICAARHLANRGHEVLLCLADPERISPAAAMQRRIFGHTRGREVTAAALKGLHPDLVLDALIGYGLSAAPRGAAAVLIRWTHASAAPGISLDLPSGLNADTGATPGDVVQAAATLTLALPKPGLVHPTAGDLFLGDLGIPAAVYERAGIAVPPLFGPRFVVALHRE